MSSRSITLTINKIFLRFLKTRRNRLWTRFGVGHHLAQISCFASYEECRAESAHLRPTYVPTNKYIRGVDLRTDTKKTTYVCKRLDYMLKISEPF